MISANDLREGMTIDLDGTLYTVEEYQHVKRGRGGAFVRTKLKNTATSQVLRQVFQPNEKIKNAFIEQKTAQFLYRDGESFHFMDMQTYEQITLHQEQIGERIAFLRENMEVSLQLYEGTVVGINLSPFVDLVVAKADPGLKGDTAGSATKPVTVESGHTLQVPLFINQGDVIRIDTRSGQYSGKQ